MTNTNQILLYKSNNGEPIIEVNVNDETIWLNQKQIAALFGTNIPAINKHIYNILKFKELGRNPTISILEIVQVEGRRKVNRKVEFYNLDMILSIGYRVNSTKATQFRIWANKILKEYLIKGFAINEKRLRQQTEQLKGLQNTIALIKNVVKSKELSGDEASGLLQVISKYSDALALLDQYDYQKLEIKSSSHKGIYKLNYTESIKLIEEMKVIFDSSKLFGKEKDDSLKGSLMNIYQTFDGKDLYPSNEEKAANLLYFLVKNHSFVDGNKRIAATLFIWFLHKNKILIDQNNNRIIDNRTLVALTLMIAESNPSDKDMMIKVIVNILILL